jgi:hypothetical protein
MSPFNTCKTDFVVFSLRHATFSLYHYYTATASTTTTPWRLTAAGCCCQLRGRGGANAGPVYHPSSAWDDHEVRLPHFAWMSTLIPGRA